MKPLNISVLILCTCLVSVARGQLLQTNIPQVQHVIILIQENRTPDNLFGSDRFANQRQLPGADLAKFGKCGAKEIQLQPLNLGNTCNPTHKHELAWVPTYDNGKMDGACTITTVYCSGKNPEYKYVQPSNVTPYFQIARQYGYAKYMFQTNQGPSFPAHQFLLSGTSAPTSSSDSSSCLDPVTMKRSPCYQWFAGENGTLENNENYGCAALHTIVPDIDSVGHEASVQEWLSVLRPQYSGYSAQQSNSPHQLEILCAVRVKYREITRWRSLDRTERDL